MKYTLTAAILVIAATPCPGATEEPYKVLEPGKSKHLHESAHFVARWNDNDGVTLSDEDLRKGLATLEGIREIYLGKVGDNAMVRGHAVVTGNGIIGGNARIEEEASVYGGTVNEDARLGALTLVEEDKTRIHGKADIAAVMNSIRSADLSGTVRLIGDIELNARTLSKGVFYGMVNQEMADNPRWGAERTVPAQEVTAVPSRSKPD